MPKLDLYGTYEEAAAKARALNHQPHLYGAVAISGPHQHAVPK